MAKFLKNEPIGEDLFSGRAQERVADTICDSIEKLYVIGLEGKWGSGKSNLVKILQKKLSNKEEKYFFFIYDAWAHQMDFQRRAIIEEIVEYIDREEELSANKNELHYVKIKALGTFTKIETEVQSSFSWATFCLICSIILTPIAIQMSTTLKFEWVNWLPTGFILLALFISIRKKLKGFFSMEHLEYIKNQLIGAYKQGNTKSTKREYTDTKKPSTAVFQQFFHDINGSIPEKHVLVIVVDNLDRLPQANIQEVWTTIQSCFSDGVVKFPRIKMVIPFDRTHLCVSSKQDGEENDIHEYIDKTFDVVFRVALPVLNDWEEYFDHQWEKAFGQGTVEENRQELDYVKRIYDCYTDMITPRNIHSFINQCVTLALLHKEDGIKYRYYAVFISHKEYILRNIIGALSNIDYLGSLKRLFERDEEYFKAIPALSYQVTLDRGQEIAIHRVLRSALQNVDTEKVKELSQIPTFPSILETLLREFTTADSLESAICALDILSPEDYGGEEIYANRWNMMFQAFRDIDIKLDTSEAGYLFPYQKVLLKHGNKEQVEAILTRLISQFKNLEDFNATRYISCIQEVEKIVTPKYIQVFDWLDEIIVSWEQLKKIITDSKQTSGKYRLRSKEEEVDTFLTNLNIEQLDTIDYLDELHRQGYELKGFKEKVKDELEQPNSYNEFCILWRNYREVIPQKIDIDLHIEYISQYIRVAKEEEDHDIESDLLCIVFSKIDFNVAENYSEIRSYFNQENRYKELADKISLYMNYSDLMLRSEQYQTSSLYCAVCRAVTSNTKRCLRANVKELLLKFRSIVKWAKIPKEEFSARLSRWPLVEIPDDEVERFLPADFLIFINGLTDSFSEECRSRVRRYLDTSPEAQWDNYIVEGIGSYGISAGRAIDCEWPSFVWPKIREYLQRLVNERKLPEDTEGWKEYVKEFLANGKKIGSVLGGLYDSLKTKAISIEEFKFWGAWIFKYDKMEVDDKTLRRFVPAELLDDEECRQIILEYSPKVVKIYKKASPDEREEFDDKIRRLMNDDENIRKLANRLGGFDVSSEAEEDSNKDKPHSLPENVQND